MKRTETGTEIEDLVRRLREVTRSDLEITGGGRGKNRDSGHACVVLGLCWEVIYGLLV